MHLLEFGPTATFSSYPFSPHASHIRFILVLGPVSHTLRVTQVRLAYTGIDIFYRHRYTYLYTGVILYLRDCICDLANFAVYSWYLDGVYIPLTAFLNYTETAKYEKAHQKL